MTAFRHRGVLFAGALGLLLLSVAEAECVAAAIRASLLLSAHALIPALLPALVLSGMLVRLAPGVHLPFQGLFSRMFRLPPTALCPFLLGALCGFPIGAATAASLCQNGDLTQEEAARAAAISANTGPAFCVAAVGVGMFHSARIGWWIYALQMISALLAGFVTRGKAQKARPTSQIVATAKFSLSDQLYHAALTLLSVTATVCFFGAIRALLSVWMPPCVATVISVLLEVGGGCAAAAELPLPLGLPLAALSVSFSGVSVLLQSAAALKPSNIPIGPLVRQKILQALLSVLLLFLIPPFFLK